MDVERAARAWLREHGADDIAHAGGSLYAHLGRVHDRLASLGLDPDVQLAGLTHAAYGTDGFPVCLLDVADRAQLRRLLGERAELLVYTYGGCDRGHTWRALGRTRLIRNRFTGAVESPPPDELRAFVDLSIVNELDVIEHQAGSPGDWLRDLVASWASLASPAVMADAERVLGQPDRYQLLVRRSRHGRPSGS